MKNIQNPKELRTTLNTYKKEGKSVGFVPTMGALHDGHFSLIKRSVSENDITVCSIFVNPTQFNNKNDLANYPNTLEADLSTLRTLGCDIAFVPSVDDMYPDKHVIGMNFGNLESVMEGVHRPGHFNGVALVVSKFFHMVLPDIAYFGQKDLQQFAIISQLVQDLAFPIELVCCPTMREDDGLAMSSRNLLIDPAHRNLAPLIYKALNQTKFALQEGIGDVPAAIDKGISLLQPHPEFTLEYIEVVDFKTLMPIRKYDSNTKTAICIASMLGKVRLIDNIVF